MAKDLRFTEVDHDDFRNLLEEIARTRMPFGRYGIQAQPPDGVPIIDLPEEYLEWFHRRGFPKGRLGELLAQVHAIKVNGMDSLFDPIRRLQGGRHSLRKRPPRTRDFGSEEGS